MAVKLRLMRMGKTKQPTYRVVAADARSPRNGRFIEIIGTYEPRRDPFAERPAEERDVGGGLNVVYAGKFAPLWGIREMLDAVASLRDSGHAVTLHVYGDKIHNPADDPVFKPEIARRLASDAGVVWHGAVERNRLLGELSGMDAGWAWRHSVLESATHELSTKLLEYASAGVPPIMARNPVNLSVFGETYPLYADTPQQAIALLARLARDTCLRADAILAARAASKKFDFASVRDFIRSQGLLPAEDQGAVSSIHDSRVST